MELSGSIPDKPVQRSLENESRRHGDLVQGDFLDSYHNLSYKGIMGNLWVAEFCAQVDFVPKTDDDMFVDLYQVQRTCIPYIKPCLKNPFNNEA